MISIRKCHNTASCIAGFVTELEKNKKGKPMSNDIILSLNCLLVKPSYQAYAWRSQIKSAFIHASTFLNIHFYLILQFIFV